MDNDKEKVMVYIQDKDGFNLNDYLEWAVKNNININIAECIIVELVNDGLIKEDRLIKEDNTESFTVM